MEFFIIIKIVDIELLKMLVFIYFTQKKWKNKEVLLDTNKTSCNIILQLDRFRQQQQLFLVSDQYFQDFLLVQWQFP